MREETIVGPDGKEYEVRAPDGASDADMIQYAQKQVAQPKAGAPMPWGDVAKGVYKNAVGSTMKLGQDIWSAVSHPIDTAESLYDLAKGTIQLAIPGEQGNEYLARAVAQMYKDRYGTGNERSMVENIKHTIAQDPAGFITDLSAVLTGGGTAVAKVGQLGGKAANLAGKATGLVKAGQVGATGAAQVPNVVQSIGSGMAKLGSTIDPIRQTSRLIGKFGRHSREGLVALHGKLTGAGHDVIEQAGAAGVRKGLLPFEVTKTPNSKIPYKVAMKKDSPFQRGYKDLDEAEDLVKAAKANVGDLKNAAQQEYMIAFDKMVADRKPISVQPLIDKFHKLEESVFDPITKRHSLVTKASEKAVLTEISKAFYEIINDPQMHNAVGLDQLKKVLNDIEVGPKMKHARRIRKALAQSAKDSVVEVYPPYKDMTKKYAKFSDLYDEIDNVLKVGINSENKHTAMNTVLLRLQSAMRNNVNTSMGNKRKLLRTIDPTEAIADSIAGQALREIMPRGMMGSYGPFMAIGSGIGAGIGAGPLAGGIAGGLLLASESPALAGKLHFGLGRLSSWPIAAGKALGPEGGRALGQGLFQAGRIKDVDARMRLEKKMPKVKKKK